MVPLAVQTDPVRMTFTTKEFDNESGMGLYYFGARYYDPEVGGWTSTDAAGQFWNPYAYAGDPISMTDPDGNFFGLDPLTAGLLYTEQGYEFQKLTSPIALHVNWSIGSEQSGFGFDGSGGTPSSSPLSYRRHAGATYYSNYYDKSYSGWETRSGGEVGALGWLAYSGTKFSSGETSQTTNMLSVGVPGLKARYENDGAKPFTKKIPGVPGADQQDRYRTAAACLELGPFSVGLNMFTGDPGPPGDLENVKNGFYADINGTSPDKYRAGALWFGIGNFRIGKNAESVRDRFQNKLIHKPNGIPEFTVMNRRDELYFYFGSGTGNTLW
jgi:RHS repeat-associated protein